MAAPGALVVVDGSFGEGGGALVRTALVMSALTMQPVRITGVRTGTSYPGLDAEDLQIIASLALSCAADVTGADLGSTVVSFHPTRRPKSLAGEIASVEGARRQPNALVVSGSLLPVLSRSGAYSSLIARGETFGFHSLGFDYFQHAVVPAYRRMGIYAFPEMRLASFGRELAGEVMLEIEPSAITALNWGERGRLKSVVGIVTTGQLPPTVGQRGAAHLARLAKSAGFDIEIDTLDVPSPKPGAHITLVATCDNGIGGATAMGARGVKTETLAQSAFEELLSWMSGDATVDPYLGDHLIIPAALAEGTSTFKTSRLTQRFLTIVGVIKQFLPIHITVKGSEDKPGTISVRR